MAFCFVSSFLDEEDTGTPPPLLINPSENIENLTIHIHKESSTGGHWCARIIFFTLSAILIGLIGIIIFEYRGATDGKILIICNIIIFHYISPSQFLQIFKNNEIL